MKMDISRFEVRLADCDEDIAAAQRLRYRVFVEEMGAKVSDEENAERLEKDRFDEYFDHLLLIDKLAEGDPLDKVVGVYRLMRGEVAKNGIGFYGASEYDLSKLENAGVETLELGRSCVAPAFRGGIAMHLMWGALGDYVNKYDIGILFGVASFHNADPEPIADALSYLYHNHLAPEEIRVRAKPPGFAEMNLMAKDQIDNHKAMIKIPSLIKAYLRFGGFVGDGAYVDVDFNTVDVCLIMDTKRMADRYRDFYSRYKS